MRYTFLLTLFFASLTSFAQRDTSFIKQISNRKVFGVHSTLQSFKLSFGVSGSEPITFQNANIAVGFRFKLKKIGGSISIPVLPLNASEKGSPKIIGLGFSLFPKSLLLSGQLRIVSGLNDFKKLKDRPIQAFQEEIRGYYVNVLGAHLFNKNQFSLRSALNMVGQQRRSAGSWLATSSIEYQSFQTDSLPLPVAGKDDIVIDHYRSYSLGFGGGYAYSFVIDHWSFTALASGGVEFRQLNYDLFDQSSTRHKFLVSPRLQFFSSVLHNKLSFFYGLTSNYLPWVGTPDDLNTRIISWSIRFTAGWRF